MDIKWWLVRKLLSTPRLLLLTYDVLYDEEWDKEVREAIAGNNFHFRSGYVFRKTTDGSFKLLNEGYLDFVVFSNNKGFIRPSYETIILGRGLVKRLNNESTK